MEEEKNKPEVNEPTTDYGVKESKRLRFFKSFEEEQEAQILYWRGLSPEERLEQHRVISLYAYSSSAKYTGNRLIFD